MSGFFAFYTGGKGGRSIPEISCWPLTLTLSHRERGPIELVDFSAYYPDFLLIIFRSGTIEFVEYLAFLLLTSLSEAARANQGLRAAPRPLGEGWGEQLCLKSTGDAYVVTHFLLSRSIAFRMVSSFLTQAVTATLNGFPRPVRRS